MPKIYASTGLAAIVVAGMIALLSVSSAQVIGTLRLPLAQCLESSAQTITLQTPLGGKLEKFSCEDGEVYLKIESLRATLEPLGVEFSEVANELLKDTKKFYLYFPDAGLASLYVPTSMPFKLAPSGELGWLTLDASYLQASTFTEALRQTGASLTMFGWDNPVLRIGKTRFQVGTASAPVRGEHWYLSVLQPRLQSWLRGWYSEDSSFDSINIYERQSALSGTPLAFRSYKQRIQTQFAAGQVVVIASREPTRSVNYKGKTFVLPPFTRMYIAPVGKDGILEYPSDAKTLRFKDDLRSLSVTPKDGAGDIVVLKFTSDLSYAKRSFEVVPSSKLSK